MDRILNCGLCTKLRRNLNQLSYLHDRTEKAIRLREQLSSELNILNNIPSTNIGLEHLKEELTRFLSRKEHQFAIKVLDHYINHHNLDFFGEKPNHSTDNFLRIRETLRELLVVE